jgi:hypothetical protein
LRYYYLRSFRQHFWDHTSLFSVTRTLPGGDNVLIAGFIITGPTGSTKTVLIRGIGPSLANAGVAGPLSDPLLGLHEEDGTVVVNDNWQQGDTSKIPNGFAPSDPRESVIVATLAPGNYSAVVKGAHGEPGVALVEVYDLNSGSTAQLANIATRGFVQTGDNVLIGGFIVGGTEPAKFCCGPSDRRSQPSEFRIRWPRRHLSCTTPMAAPSVTTAGAAPRKRTSKRRQFPQRTIMNQRSWPRLHRGITLLSSAARTTRQASP